MKRPRLRRSLPLFPGVVLPRGHSAGMRVPPGGSSCATCRFADLRRGTCREPSFVRWNESAKIPAPLDEYCSDWWQPRGERG